LNDCITAYDFKNRSAQFENFKPVVNGELLLTKQQPKKRRDLGRQMKIILANIDHVQACKENTIKPQVDREWKLNPRNKGKNMYHKASVEARKKKVKEIGKFFFPSFYYWHDKHLATIYRNFDECWESLLYAISVIKQRQKEANEEERRRQEAFHIEFVTDPESAMLGRLGAGLTDKQRYHLKQQLKGRKPVKRRKKFDTQRDEREQFLQGSGYDERGDH